VDADSGAKRDHRDPGDSEHAVMRITAAQRPLYAYIRSLVLAPEDVEDILQEVNLVLWRKIGEFDGRGPFLTWACQVAYLQVLAYCKRQRRDRHEHVDEEVLADLAAVVAGKVEQLDARVDALHRCLAKLGPQQRRMILRRYDIGGSVRAIADELGRPAASVRVTLHRIRQSLIECIAQTLATGERV
jgi:RNA polymerase sigma-70 factor, ECF subfamily